MRDLEQLITELEEVTARMLARTCWETASEFGDLSVSRHALAALLTDRRDLDANAAARIAAVIQTGDGVVARIMAMRRSVLAEIGETEARRQFTREMSATLPSHTRLRHVDMKA